MAEALDFQLDPEAAARIDGLRHRLRDVGVDVPVDVPTVRFALGAAIPPRVRTGLAAELAAELRLLVLPELWLSVLGTIVTAAPRLVLAAVVDAELLAAHSAVHDALSGRVRGPSARYLPGSWVPHCELTRELAPSALGPALAALPVVEPVRARVTAIVLTDTRTGAVTPLRGR